MKNVVRKLSGYWFLLRISTVIIAIMHQNIIYLSRPEARREQNHSIHRRVAEPLYFSICRLIKWISIEIAIFIYRASISIIKKKNQGGLLLHKTWRHKHKIFGTTHYFIDNKKTSRMTYSFGGKCLRVFFRYFGS